MDKYNFYRDQGPSAYNCEESEIDSCSCENKNFSDLCKNNEKLYMKTSQLWTQNMMERNINCKIDNDQAKFANWLFLSKK